MTIYLDYVKIKYAFGEDEKFPKMKSGDNCTTMCVLQLVS